MDWNNLLRLSTFVLSIFSTGLVGSSLVNTFEDNQIAYHLYFSKLKYSWSNAGDLCKSIGGVVAIAPFPGHIMTSLKDYYVVGAVWITNQNGDCMSFKEECQQVGQSAFGTRCIEKSLASIEVDCRLKKRFVICSREIIDSTTTSVPLTDSATNPIPSTSRPTQAPSTRLTPSPIFTKKKFNPSSRPPTPPKPLFKYSTTHATSQQDWGNAPGLAKIILGFAVGKKDLLGLIIGVVTGTFTILALLLVLCCACQGQTPKTRSRLKRSEFPEKHSQSSLIRSGHSDSHDSSNTLDHAIKSEHTEESSLELSDIASHSNKVYSVYPTPYSRGSYPPPPDLYKTDDLGRSKASTPRQVVMSVSRHRESDASDEFPLPPPPPLSKTAIEESDEDETCIKGLSPKFRTFLDKTIAVPPKPLLSPTHRKQFPSLSIDDNPKVETRGLLTSDL